MSFARLFSGLFFGAILAHAGIPGVAQTAGSAPPLIMELNAAADTTAGNCRLTYVVRNATDTALASATYEVAIFDQQGVVQRMLALDFGALDAGKTRILQFDLAGSPCAAISQIIVNTAPSCVRSADGAATDICIQGLEVTSRTAIRFGL
jgi:hypothetical protein